MADTSRSFGFLTLAFGKAYRKLAQNLLISYKRYGNTMPFCVITDKADRYVRDFDIVVVKEPLSKGFFNKLYLEQYTPFQKTIFIDADCLVFKNIGSYFEAFEKCGFPFSVLGRNFVIAECPERKGYFDFQKAASFHLTHTSVFNGGMYYFDEKSGDIFETAREIANSGIDYGFPFPGDEPCLALSMSIHGCMCYTGEPIKGLTWFPRAKNISIDIANGKINYQFEEIKNVDQTAILHFGTFNTYKPFYKSTVFAIKHRQNRLMQFFYRHKIIYSLLSIPYFFVTSFNRIKAFISRCIHFVFRRLKKLLERKK